MGHFFLFQLVQIDSITMQNHLGYPDSLLFGKISIPYVG